MRDYSTAEIYSMAEELNEFERPRRNGRSRPAAPGIKIIPFDQIRIDKDHRPYMVKGLIPRDGLTVVWGPPKSGKSFAVFDLCMHVALGWEYRGRRVQQGSVVYCSFEGQGGLAARIEAFRQQHLAEETEDIPFHAQTMTLDLVKQADDLIAAIKSVGIEPSIVALDTLNRSLRGSENSDEDMAAYIQACDRIREAFGCAVIIIHHCGVLGTRPRGHTSLTGAADAQLACSRDRNNNVELKVEWMKDGDSEGQVVASTLKSIEVGTDANGEPITSCVVVPAEPAVQVHRNKPLPQNQQTMLTILEAAGKDGLVLSDWNEKAKSLGIGVKRHASLYDAQQALKQANLVHCYAERWYANSVTQ